MKIKKSDLIKNSLGYDSNLYVYQDKKMFNYSVDTILLANWSTINSKVKKILEIGANNGALSIFLSERSNDVKIDAIEIQERAVEIAKINLELNKKEDLINIIHDDFNFFWKKHCKNMGEKYDSIIVNPPFYTLENKTKTSSSIEKLIATHEVKINLKQIVEGSSKIINQKGYLSFVIPPERLVDLIVQLKTYDFEPKRIKFIHPRTKEKAILVLIESRFKAGIGTKFEKNIYLHPEDPSRHEYLEEVKNLYKPKKVKKN